MKLIPGKSAVAAALVAFAIVTTSGCATLAVTPVKSAKPATARPLKVGIVTLGGGPVRETLSDTSQSPLTAATGSLFESVRLLPPEAQFQGAADILAAYGTDYIITTTLSDVNVGGSLNPLWFASMPLLFFKPYAPIVTYEAIITLDHQIKDARTGSVVMNRQISEGVTDHFSPINPQDKVRKLMGRSINNGFIILLEELHEKLPPSR